MPGLRSLVPIAAALLLASCAASDEEREVRFPRGTVEPCERPAPRAALASGGRGLLSHEFHLQGPGKAVESARLEGGIRLELRHETCGRHSQTFRFYLPKSHPAPEGPAETYALSAQLMRSVAAPGRDGAALRELALALSSAAVKGTDAPPLASRIELGEFQELIVSTKPAPETDAYIYATILTIAYRLKL